jgi:hypothetical protein
MKTLYDLLGIRPDADAETVKRAFRAAAKLHHPDHHPGDPDAAFRFRQIVAADAILRDAKRRAAYDRRLALERQRIRSKWTRIISEAIYVPVLSIVLVIGSVGIEHMSSPSVMPDKVEGHTARAPSETAAVLPATPTDATARDGSGDKLEEMPERVIEPSAAAPATDGTGVQAFANGPALRLQPNEPNTIESAESLHTAMVISTRRSPTSIKPFGSIPMTRKPTTSAAMPGITWAIPTVHSPTMTRRSASTQTIPPSSMTEG